MVVRIDSQATPPPMTRSITHTTVLTQSELNRPRNVWPWNAWVRLESVNQEVPWSKSRGAKTWTKKAPTGTATRKARMAHTSDWPA